MYKCISIYKYKYINIFIYKDARTYNNFSKKSRLFILPRI